MATFPLLKPSAAPITPGAWPVSTIGSLNGAESRVRQGSAEIGRRLRLTFTNITEADFLAILSHYRGQRSGFDAFGFDVFTLAADRTPSGYAWLYASRPQVVDEHLDVFTVQCEFKAEPRGLVVAMGAAWRSAQTSLTRNVAPGKAFLTSSTTFLPGTGARFAAGLRWVTESTRFTRDSVGQTAAWVTSATTFTPGNRTVAAEGAIPVITGGTATIFTYDSGWTFTVSSSKVIKGFGFYDDGQDGLSGSYKVSLKALINPANLAAGYNAVQINTASDPFRKYNLIVSGTSTVSGVWRRVDLVDVFDSSYSAGATLTPGTTYLLLADLYTATEDNAIKNATSITLPTNVNYVQNYDDVSETITNAADGIAYFGPMIFFE